MSFISVSLNCFHGLASLSARFVISKKPVSREFNHVMAIKHERMWNELTVFENVFLNLRTIFQSKRKEACEP